MKARQAKNEFILALILADDLKELICFQIKVELKVFKNSRALILKIS